MNKWTREEDNLLINNYQLKKADLIKLFPNRTTGAVQARAFVLGLKKDDLLFHNHPCKALLDVLLLDDCETYYWIGFLLADGHFSIKGNISLSISNKDSLHLQKFAKFISCDNISIYKNIVSVNAQDAKIVRLIKEKFDIKNNKTYSPPNLSWIVNKDLFLSLLIGYIDGDGCIRYQTGRRDTSIQFHVDSSWIDVLFLIKTRLAEYYNINSGVPIIGKDGYAKSNISNSALIKKLKTFAIYNMLPILNRKWDKIDLNFTSKQEISKIRKELAIDMLVNGFTIQEISDATGIVHIRQFLKRNNIQTN